MKFKRAFVLITITVAAIFVGFVLHSFNLFRKSSRAHDWLSQTYAEMSRLEDVQSRLLTLPDFVTNSTSPESATQTINVVYRSLDTLSFLMKDQPQEISDLASLRILASQKFGLLKEGDHQSRIQYIDYRIADLIR